MDQRLEGPGAEQRLRDIQRRFQRAGGGGRRRRRGSTGLFVSVFAAVFVAALIALERPDLPARLLAGLQPSASADQATPVPRYFRNCDEARAAGVAPLYRWEPGYREAMDRDYDGVACEPYY
jgi:hypothetical protein